MRGPCAHPRHGCSALATQPICPILCFWGAKFPKMGDSLPRMPLKHHAKFDIASFILGGEIRNRTNTHKISVNDISTPCLPACADNKTKDNDVQSGTYWAYFYSPQAC